MTVPIIVAFAGYSLMSYGFVLIKGWDITFREWMSPLTPYQFPAGKIPTVAPGQIFPTGASAETTASLA
jgi:hypothetical protein